MNAADQQTVKTVPDDQIASARRGRRYIVGFIVVAAALVFAHFDEKSRNAAGRENGAAAAVKSSQQSATDTTRLSKQPDPVPIAQRASPKGPLEKMQAGLEHLASHPNALCRNGIEGPYGTRVMFGNLLRAVANQDQAQASQYWPAVKERFQAAQDMGCFADLGN